MESSSTRAMVTREPVQEMAARRLSSTDLMGMFASCRPSEPLRNFYEDCLYNDIHAGDDYSSRPAFWAGRRRRPSHRFMERSVTSRPGEGELHERKHHRKT